MGFLFIAYLRSLVTHKFVRVEFQKIVLIFSTLVAFKKHQQIFEIRHVQIHELPRTYVSKYLLQNNSLFSGR